MKFDIFLSICQTEVDGFMPDEKEMWLSFFDQVELADQLGFGTAWVAETHLSCEIQKTGPYPVIPHFKGEIGLNTDILQLAHLIFTRTQKIHVGSAIRNILCNGGPIAHAEEVRTFLALHGLNESESRKLELGFASGRFEFSNRPYGIRPRNEIEAVAWPVVKGKILREATEIFLRLLRGDILAREELAMPFMMRADFRDEASWQKALKAYGKDTDRIELAPFFTFEKLGVIPRDVRMELLNLTLGSHDPQIQKLANEILPVGVFNLSITPPEVIEATHMRMREQYHPSGGKWRRELMPRTAMVFLDRTDEAAKIQAERAWENYWRAMEGTLDSKKVEDAVENAIAGSPDTVAEKIRQKYHSEDRLMCWFDFNNHDNEFVKQSMRTFKEKVVSQLV